MGQAGEAAHVDQLATAWPLWRRLCGLFPAWSLLPSAFYTPGAWTMIGVDFVRGLRANANTRAAFALLAEASPAELDALAALAAINARRQERVFRAVALAYLTVPLSLAATFADVAPDSLQAYVRAHLTSVIGLAAVLTFSALTYFASSWRAHQLLDVLDLHRVRRDARPYATVELRGAD